MIHIWRAAPLLIVGAGAAWLVDKGWFVIMVQVVTTLLIALGAILRRWSADTGPA